MAEKDIFISYKSEDSKSALWVKGMLEGNGLSCWMAPDSIPAGSSYAKEIPKGIKQCKIFLLVVTKNTLNSRWIPRELDKAINSKKVVIPLMLENVVFNDDLEFYLSNIQHYDLYTDRNTGIKELIESIKFILDEKDTNNSLDYQFEQVTETKQIKKQPTENKKSATIFAAGAIILAFVFILGVFILYGEKTNPKESTAPVSETANETLENNEIYKTALKHADNPLMYNGHAYGIFNYKNKGLKSFSQCEKYCEKIGGHLVVINDNAENTAVYNYLRKQGLLEALIGLTDEKEEGVWVWKNGAESDYRNWAAGQPNNGATNGNPKRENYVEFSSKTLDGKWNDITFNSQTQYFICEWE